MRKTFKSLKSWKVWIVIAFVAAFLLACGALVYARSGFQLHERSFSWCTYCAELTVGEWNQIMQKIDSLVNIKTN